jgi:hypothetical protein
MLLRSHVDYFYCINHISGLIRIDLPLLWDYLKDESTPKNNFHGYLNYFSQTISTAKNAKNDAKCAKCSLSI